jgi:hypothetical protein
VRIQAWINAAKVRLALGYVSYDGCYVYASDVYISKACGIHHSTVRLYLDDFTKVGDVRVFEPGPYLISCRIIILMDHENASQACERIPKDLYYKPSWPRRMRRAHGHALKRDRLVETGGK